MRCELIPLGELTDADLSAWRSLAAEAVSRNPFAEPELVLPAARVLAGGDQVQVLVVRDGPDWLAALPVRHYRRYRRVPGRSLASWRHRYCFLGTPLVSPRDPISTLTQLIVGGVTNGSCLVLDWIEADGPLAAPFSDALAAAGRSVEIERFERPALYRRVDGAYLENAVSAAHRADYRRLRRRLERSVGALTLRDESADPDAPARFMKLESSGWKQATQTALATSGHGRFFTEMCAGFASIGRLQMLALVGDDQPVAMACNVIGADTMYGFKVAYDERYRRDGPGMQLMISSIDHFHELGMQRFDSCADADSAWTGRLFVDRRPLRTVVATPRSVPGAARAATWWSAAAALTQWRAYQRAGGAGALLRRLRGEIGAVKRRTRSG
jgi:CelD/BcsL family acetyltransferase involved in cellulose biosynthesis